MNHPPRRSGQPVLGGRACYSAENWAPVWASSLLTPHVTFWAVGCSDIRPGHTFVTRHEVSFNGRTFRPRPLGLPRLAAPHTLFVEFLSGDPRVEAPNMGQAVVRESLFLAAVHRNTCSVTPHVPLFGVSENMTTLLLR